MIYYLEDDEQIRNMTLYALEHLGFEAQGFPTAASLYKSLHNLSPDQMPQLFILDVMLPDEDGISVLKKLRADKRTQNIPVIMLTAKNTEYDTVVGLDSGADDYLGKPFGMMELASRIRAVMRRAAAPRHDENAEVMSAANVHSDVINIDGLSIDPSRYEVSYNAQTVSLTPKEFDLLHYLMLNAGFVLDRTHILERIWGFSDAGHTRTVDTHIQTLRKKIMEINPQFDSITTVHGVGYRFEDKGSDE